MKGKFTVNELLSLCKAVRGRLNSLEGLRDKVSVQETIFGQKEKLVEPQYNVKEVDKRIVKLQNFLFEADSKIKQSNAMTSVEIVADSEELLSPIA